MKTQNENWDEADQDQDEAAAAPAATNAGPQGMVVQADEPLPNNLRAAFAALRAAENLPEKTENDRIFKQAKLKRIKAHCFALQQTPAAPVIDAHCVAAIASARRGQAEARRIRLEKLQAILDREPNLMDESQKPDSLSANPTQTPKQNLLSCGYVHNRIEECKRLLVFHEAEAIRHFDLCYPAERLKELEHELAGTSNPDEIRALKSTMAALQTTSHEGRFRGLVAQKFDPAREALDDLVATCVLILEIRLLEAQKEEITWLAAFDLPHEKTPLSRRYEKAIADLKSITIGKHTLEWFGVMDVCE